MSDFPRPIPAASRPPFYSLASELGPEHRVICPVCQAVYYPGAISPADEPEIPYEWACGRCKEDVLRKRDAAAPVGLTMADVRGMRATKLAATDWTQMPDVPPATSQKYRAYRQALRDVTKGLTDPNAVQWPQPPE